MSEQLSMNVPNCNANKGVRLSLDIRHSRKAVKCLLFRVYHCVRNIINLTLILWKTDSKANLNKRKKSWLSTKFPWKEGGIFKRYSRNLNFSQIIFWVCHVKKYFQNAMSMILDNLNLIFWVSNWISLVWNRKYC